MATTVGVLGNETTSQSAPRYNTVRRESGGYRSTGAAGLTVAQTPSKPKASDTLAAVTRESWQDWLSQGPGLQEALMGMTTYNNPNLASQEVARGVDTTNRALDVADNSYALNMSSYGLAPTAEQQAVNSRLSGLNRSTQTVNAANQIRQALMDRNRSIAMGGVTATNYNKITNS